MKFTATLSSLLLSTLLIPMSATAGEIRNRADMCLDVHRPDLTNNGGKVQIWDCNGQIQQQWSVKSNGEIRNGAGMCLDVHRPDLTNNGGKVQVWDCNGEIQQQWSVK